MVAKGARFGLIVTLLGTLMFVPDTLVLRIVAADMMDVAVLRALFAFAATLIGIALFARHTIPTRAELFQGSTLLFILLHGLGTVLFLTSLSLTSVANVLLISATAPFLSALMSYFFLKERIDRMTAYGIVAVFAGVGIIASGSLGGGAMLGNLVALANAVMSAAYYVVVRHTATRSQLVPSVFGFLVTALVALPFAGAIEFSAQQVALVGISGAVILAGGSALLIIGPRYLPAPEVTMIIMLESVAAPVLVWLVLGENPGPRTVLGGAVIFAALVAHTIWRWRKAVPDVPATIAH
jgi:drug/metabolite transporter (DMT)-like permease